MVKTTKIKELNYYKLAQMYKESVGVEVIDYKVRNFLEELVDLGVYSYDFERPKGKLKITFPLFLILIILGSLYGAVKWIFTANSRLDVNSWFVRSLVKWDKYCGFKIM